MKTALTALFCTILLFLTFILGVNVGKRQLKRTTPPATQSSVIIIDSSGGNNISVVQGNTDDSGEVTKEQLQKAFKVSDIFVPKKYKVIKYKGMYSVLMPGGSIFYHFKTKEEAEHIIEQFIVHEKEEWDENKMWEYNNPKVIHQKTNGSGDNIAGDKVIKNENQ